jgi:murein DD-endopeptidase / murein LD-carboxypeptidase
MIGDTIAKRALSQIGVPFRLHGRVAGQALDCVGLAGYALFGAGGHALPLQYSLRGDFTENVHQFFAKHNFIKLESGSDFLCGDIILCQTAPQQMHLMVRVNGGFVHAHAGLRKIVFTPLPSPWPILCGWRTVKNNQNRKS